MSSATAQREDPNKGGNKFLFGAAMFFMFVIVIGIIVTAIASARNNSRPTTMTPGSGNGLYPSQSAVAAAPVNRPQIK